MFVFNGVWVCRVVSSFSGTRRGEQFVAHGVAAATVPGKRQPASSLRHMRNSIIELYQRMDCVWVVANAKPLAGSGPALMGLRAIKCDENHAEGGQFCPRAAFPQAGKPVLLNLRIFARRGDSEVWRSAAYRQSAFPSRRSRTFVAARETEAEAEC